ncbi:hypothetical protein KC19_1G322700 [Ceratodon purpureus]|uniref:Uncharacterized protein n=1 Tax=Ceratodon purpureus TaxID=3225 RepID=A0A8T0JEM5_CERPU|nr:hypothetical protein KC19_1G322700 [Ceratodon purpureus]
MFSKINYLFSNLYLVLSKGSKECYGTYKFSVIMLMKSFQILFLLSVLVFPGPLLIYADNSNICTSCNYFSRGSCTKSLFSFGGNEMKFHCKNKSTSDPC